MTKETVGKIATDLLKKDAETTDPIEIQREMQKDYEKNIHECIIRAKKDLGNIDFYIVVETKKERLLENVLRNYFFYRRTCPTPTYDQTVYKYHKEEDVIEFLWVLPSKDTCELFRDNILQIHPEERDLLNYILEFHEGTLLEKCKILNNEQKNNPLLIN